MPSPHVIRLHGPWHCQPLARTVRLSDGTSREEPGELPPACRVRIPCDWGETLGQDFRGRVRYVRYFHRPTGLNDADRVALVLFQVDAIGEIALNGTVLGPICAGSDQGRFDITDQLLSRNNLSVEVELPRTTASSADLIRPTGREKLPGGLVGEVRLEIG